MADDTTITQHITAGKTWLRAVFMLLFAAIYQVAEFVVLAVAVFQFLVVLFTGETNTRLLEFGKSLSRFMYDLMRFFTFGTEDKPFPLAPWPPVEPPAQTESKPSA